MSMNLDRESHKLGIISAVKSAIPEEAKAGKK